MKIDHQQISTQIRNTLQQFIGFALTLFVLSSGFLVSTAGAGGGPGVVLGVSDIVASTGSPQVLEVTDIELIDISSQGATVRWAINKDIIGRVPHGVNQNNLPLPGKYGVKYAEDGGKYFYEVRISEIPLDKRNHFYKIFIDEDGTFGNGIAYGSPLRNFLTESSGSHLNPDLVVSDIQVISDKDQNLRVEVTVTNEGLRSSDPAKAKLLLIYGTNKSDIDMCLLGFCENVADRFEASQLLVVPSLSVGESVVISYVNNLTFVEGDEYLIKAVVDNKKIIAEANEGNNVGTLNFILGEETTESTEIIEETGNIQPTPEASAGTQDDEVANDSDNASDFVEIERSLVANSDSTLTDRLAGEILLQVESRGEAWYVDEKTSSKYYLADGASAYNALRTFGLGVTNVDIAKIPIGLEKRADIRDTDKDGLDDRLEQAIGTDLEDPDTDDDGAGDGVEIEGGYDPLGSGKWLVNSDLVNRLEGKILLQVESRGEAWWVHGGKRYYLADGDMAYQIMRFLSLGVTNEDLRKIGVGKLSLRFCPDEWIDNRMPGPPPTESTLAKQYYIVDGLRRELGEFDVDWVAGNCDLEVNVVY